MHKFHEHLSEAFISEEIKISIFHLIIRLTNSKYNLQSYELFAIKISQIVFENKNCV